MESLLQHTRRHFLSRAGLGLGTAALASLFPSCRESDPFSTKLESASVPKIQQIPRAKRVIYLFQSGGPSQLELFDYKAQLQQTLGRATSAIRS